MDRRKLFVFDLDGTMFDTEIISYQCWRDVSARYGFQMGRDVFDLMLGRDNLRVRSTCENAFGPTYPYDRVCKEKIELQLEYYRTHDIPMKPGLLHILEYAKEQGILCAVASSSPRKLIEYLLKRQLSIPSSPSSKAEKKQLMENRNPISFSWLVTRRALHRKTPWSWKIQKAESWQLMPPESRPYGFRTL